MNVNQIKRSLHNEQLNKKYAEKNRWIPNHIYTELKRQKRCWKCNKVAKGKFLEIHHIVSVRDGGTNAKKNLVAVCHSCHKILDNEQKDKNEQK